MPITRVENTNRPRHVIDQLLCAIHDGSLACGDRLPSEAKLAEMAGVGRTSVREALTALRLMGVVETRVGAGSFVAVSADGPSLRSGFSDQVAQAISLSEEAVHLQEARAVFEAGMVRLAATRWMEDMDREADNVLSQMTQAADHGEYEAYIALHRAFHLMLAQATQNAVVVQTAHSFLASMDHEGWRDMERQSYLPNRRTYLARSVEEHRGILDAVRAGDGLQASERMHRHFSRHEDAGHLEGGL